MTKNKQRPVAADPPPTDPDPGDPAEPLDPEALAAKAKALRDSLPGFLARLIGWSDKEAVEVALRTVTMAAAGVATVMLCGKGELLLLAEALHRRVRANRPFVLVAPRRHGQNRRSPRSAARYPTILPALEAAAGGTLCFALENRPADLPMAARVLRARDDVMIILCGAEVRRPTLPFTLRPPPIVIPPLSDRGAELDRIIWEYAAEALQELKAPDNAFTDDDHAWVRQQAARTLPEIEAATLRRVARNTSPSSADAARRLGISNVSLTRWLDRRELQRLGTNWPPE